MTEMERWRPVIGLELRYEVSSRGRVRSLPFETVRKNGRPYRHPGCVLRPAEFRRHAYVMLYVRVKVSSKRWVHRLVAEMFVGPPPSELHEVNHKDGNPRNNTPGNLEWLTEEENQLHASVNQLAPRGEEKPNRRLTRRSVAEALAERSERGTSIRCLAAKHGVGKTTMEHALAGRTWKLPKLGRRVFDA